MPEVGYWSVLLTLLISVYAGGAALWGARRRDTTLLESARNAALVAGALATFAAALLVYALLTHEYTLRYVYAHVSDALPAVFTLSAFWAGSEGSLLLWMWLVALLTTGLVLWRRAWEAPRGPYLLAVMASTQAFLALVMVALSNPFATLGSAPVDGQGLNPLLQNVWMVAHPPVVFMGYAAYTVPFALAIAGLATGQMGDHWLTAVRRWSLLAWLFLGSGILMGAWWAYLELGWGGYWGWDPVENSSLVPWLTGTALLHSLMMQQRRNAYRTWNLWLVALTFAFVLFATFVTRSGVIQSVHAFGRSAIGTSFLLFIALCLIALGVLIWRRRQTLSEEYAYRSVLSREVSLLATVLLMLGAALVVLLGTLFPALAELVQGRQAALDVTFYERAVGPLALAFTALIGVCPWLAWGGTSGARLRRDLLPALGAAAATAVVLPIAGVRAPVAVVAFAVCAFVAVSLLGTFYRGAANRARCTGEALPLAFARAMGEQHRRYGAHVVHLGIVLIALGVTGSSVYQEEVQIALAPGEEMEVQGYTLAYEDLISEELPDRQRFVAVVGVRRGDRQVVTLRPEKAFHWNIEQWVTEVATRSTFVEDLYLILAGFESDGLISLRVLINPLVIWLWIGGGMLLGGGVMAWWPSGGKEVGDDALGADADRA
ncbi:MAG: heme lyase CcmF/NrfE family subunit [Anaerolineae bacterium]|nr:heme lyase CcmF/NrfE family subunit [Anaerolineae bacterium]